MVFQFIQIIVHYILWSLNNVLGIFPFQYILIFLMIV
jgi:hypothetical protein